MKTLTQEQIWKLIKQASRYTLYDRNEDHPDDEIYPHDLGHSGDSFDRGIEDGETYMARDVLKWLDVPYEIDRDEY